MQKLAYKENVIEKYEELHPEKKKKPPSGGSGGIPGMEGLEGMGGGKYDDILRQMKGDFSSEQDPERRRLLEQLGKMGMSFGGGSGMDTQQLREMVKMMSGIRSDMGGAGGMGGMGGAGGMDGDLKAESDMEDVADEDKMEL